MPTPILQLFATPLEPVLATGVMCSGALRSTQGGGPPQPSLVLPKWIHFYYHFTYLHSIHLQEEVWNSKVQWYIMYACEWK